MIQRRLLVFFVVAACVACGTQLDPPPLELTHRDSLLGAGKVVQIKNTSNEPLTELVVRLRSSSGEERSYNQENLEGFASFEIGWKKLGGWEIPEGAEVEVSCKGYVKSFKGRIE